MCVYRRNLLHVRITVTNKGQVCVCVRAYVRMVSKFEVNGGY